jgi:hypothetical protein
VPFAFVKNVVQIAFCLNVLKINANISWKKILGCLYDCIYFHLSTRLRKGICVHGIMVSISLLCHGLYFSSVSWSLFLFCVMVSVNMRQKKLEKQILCFRNPRAWFSRNKVSKM